jgi:hypothetical protein
MANKIKVSFEIEDSYNIQGFRNFLKYVQSDDKFELYIISNDDDSALILRIGSNLGLDPSKVIVCNFTQDKIQAIVDNNINIHLDNLQSTIMLVQETTTAYGILVTKNLNKYYLEPDYVIVFNRVVEEIESNAP